MVEECDAVHVGNDRVKDCELQCDLKKRRVGDCVRDYFCRDGMDKHGGDCEEKGVDLQTTARPRLQ